MSLIRTQISFSEEQRQFLQRLAREQGRSIADILRSMVEREMETRVSEDDPLFDIVGMVAGPTDTGSQTTDQRLYRKDWQ